MRVTATTEVMVMERLRAMLASVRLDTSAGESVGEDVRVRAIVGMEVSRITPWIKVGTDDGAGVGGDEGVIDGIVVGEADGAGESPIHLQAVLATAFDGILQGKQPKVPESFRLAL
jgi:hypothetical protein